jgi:hypothetical protein
VIVLGRCMGKRLRAEAGALVLVLGRWGRCLGRGWKWGAGVSFGEVGKRLRARWQNLGNGVLVLVLGRWGRGSGQRLGVGCWC